MTVLPTKHNKKQLCANTGEKLVDKLEKQAKTLGLNVSKQWIYGDKLYE